MADTFTPITPLAKLPSNASSTDKTILGPTLQKVIDTVNALGVEVAALKAQQPDEPPAPVVVSVQVTLTAQTIRVGDTTQANAILKDATGQVLAGAILGGRAVVWSTGKPDVATVDATGKVTAVGQGAAIITGTFEGLAANASLIVQAVQVPPTPPPPTPTTSVEKVIALIGPMRSVAEVRAMGGIFTQYETLRQTSLDRMRILEGTQWEGNYYDRVEAELALWAAKGGTDATLYDHAMQLAVSYRRGYLEANGYGTSPHQMQVQGLELHYRLTGDELSRKAIAAGYAHGLTGFVERNEIANPAVGYMENRIQARILQVLLAAHRTGAAYTRPDGLAFTAASWAPLARTVLNAIATTQQPDGSWSWSQVCGGQLNYMVGMLVDVLLEYDRSFEQDARIPGIVERALDFLWAHEWDATRRCFHYQSVHGACAATGGDNVGTNDLNGLFVNGFGWMYARTGDAKWKARAESVLEGLVNYAAITGGGALGSKQTNQSFSVSYRVFAYLASR